MRFGNLSPRRGFSLVEVLIVVVVVDPPPNGGVPPIPPNENCGLPSRGPPDVRGIADAGVVVRPSVNGIEKRGSPARADRGGSVPRPMEITATILQQPNQQCQLPYS